jgi:hypothetical protein
MGGPLMVVVVVVVAMALVGWMSLPQGRRDFFG